MRTPCCPSPRFTAVLLLLLVLPCFLVIGCSGGSSSSSSPAPVAPSVVSITPTTLPAGSAAFTLMVSGQSFTSSSEVIWNGGALTTTFVSATQLTAAVPASYLANSGPVNVAVLEPNASLVSTNMTFTISAPIPAISAVSPTNAVVGSADLTLTLTGLNFDAGSVVQAGTTALQTTYASSTKLTAVLPAALLGSVGSLSLSVANPAPNASTSSATAFAVVPQPAPAIATLSPTNAIIDSTGVQVTVSGTNFLAGAVVKAGATALNTSFVSASVLRASVPDNLLTALGTLELTVQNPSPNGGTSAMAAFPVIAQPAPSINALTPATIEAGSSGFTLTLTGQYFSPNSVVMFNGQVLTPSQSGTTSLSVAVPDALIATAGSLPVKVLSPEVVGDALTSAPVNFVVSALPAGTFVVEQTANDIVADPTRNLLYVSVPSRASQNANDVVVIDPTTGTITKSVSVGSEPDRMAISTDGAHLYVALDGSSTVVRLALPDLTPEFTVSLGADSFFGANTALDLAAAPGTAGTWAVTTGNVGVSPAAQEGIQVYDNAKPRGAAVGRNSAHGGFDLLLGAITWGADASVVYGANNESTGFDLYVLPITGSGVGTIADYGGLMPGFNNAHIHFDATTNLVYGDDGYVVNGIAGAPAGQFAANGPMVPDGALNRAFFVSNSLSNNGLTMTSFDLTKYTPISTYSVPSVVGTPGRLVRWGSNGLAFNTLTYNYSTTSTTVTGKVFIYSGSFVQP